jgi:hypothetical protein
MKKFQIYGTLALVALSVTLTSCFKNEEADIFDKSASERLEEAKKYYSDILTDKGGKWQMEYFANGDEHGYVYLMTFNKNGQVKIAGENTYIGYADNHASDGSPKYGEATSLWEVVADNGPVLSFNSYNKYFHIFSSPYDIPPYGQNEIDESGEGHLGDYEFDLMKYSNDTLYIEGKKREIKMIMTRVDASVDDHVYMDYVTAMADSFFHYKVPRVFMNLPNGEKYVIEDGASQMPSIWKFHSDSVVTVTYHNGIINHDGFALMDPYEFDGYKVQRFKLQSDGSLVCVENPEITVDAGPLNYAILFDYEHIMQWNFNLNSFSGELATLYNEMRTQINKGTRRLKTINMYYADKATYNKLVGSGSSEDFSGYVLVFNVEMRQGATINVILPVDPVMIGENDFTMQIGEAKTTQGANLVSSVPSMAEFIQALSSHKFHLSAKNVLSPTVLNVAYESDASSSFELVVK